MQICIYTIIENDEGGKKRAEKKQLPKKKDVKGRTVVMNIAGLWLYMEL